MKEPLVCAIMLTRDRPAMAARAVAAFRAQTYDCRRLFIHDNGQDQNWSKELELRDNEIHFRCFWNAHRGQLTIGLLRNEANGYASEMPDDPQIILHWDDDDLSHPNRIAEQVALLQSSGKECVGYRECLFWNTSVRDYPRPGGARNEAWLYHNADPRRALGASLCYWRSVWEKRPFPDMPKGRNATGEDHWWLQGVDSLGVSAFQINQRQQLDYSLLICSIHGGNSMDYDPAGLVAHGSPNWKRVPEWDDYAEEKMCLSG